MSAFGVGSLVLVLFAIIGLVVLTVGIVFFVKNVKWKKEREQQGLSVLSNIIAMVIFGFMIFFGAAWLICFGVGAVAFGIIGSTM